MARQTGRQIVEGLIEEARGMPKLRFADDPIESRKPDSLRARLDRLPPSAWDHYIGKIHTESIGK